MDFSSILNHDPASIEAKIAEFKSGFNSVFISSLGKNGEVLSSYAPLIQSKHGDFIYISSVADHYENIISNPNNISIMFLEDECAAASPIVRKRLRYKASASKIERDSELFNSVFDEFEAKLGSNRAIAQIRAMGDFAMFKLELSTGRAVFGFGKAYDINNGVITQATGANPHNMPHKH